ncbi:MAG: hypothetical protein WKF34_08815 [Pyrinomonadaceae bacterium]
MEPLDQLKLITDWETGPALTEAELEAVLGAYAREDSNGLSVQNEEWTPTYDINAAASKAWLLKAARAASLVEIDPPGSGVVTSRVFENCRAMARIYAGKRRMTVSLSS